MKQLLLSLLLAGPGLALAQRPAPAPAPITYTLRGTIGKLNAPAKIYLVRPAIMDSATLKNGVFELKGHTDVPKEMVLILSRNGNLRQHHLWEDAPEARDAIRVFLEPTPVVLTSPDSLRHATVQGGPLTTDHRQLLAALQPIEDQQNALDAAYERAPKEQQQRPEFKQPLLARQQALRAERDQRRAAFIKAHPGSWVSLEVLQKFGSVPQYAEVAPLYEVLSPALKSTPPGQEYARMLQAIKRVAIGAEAPDFTQLDPAGQPVRLSSLRGKYVLIDFWASWCRPCREENPNVVKAYHEFKGRNFDVLGVSLDSEKSREKWLQAIKDDQLPWTQVSDLKGWQNAAAEQYHVLGIPQNFLLDPSGKIIAVNLRGEELRAALARYLQ
ncbi:AhpC/TSA family protein [Hymenobacter gummosus]|uniref:AhpC/TSA family protein n=1 Tax=Hymenobacter gummosus TaxID=1776032 RepID=A0A3S0J6J4_9BACT|nr:TlpA disulfide reductase family protein [Hymenobacter gummosus]RTQ45916.1 AhpC/TSA family protein [Hymenobacter gummosus]